MLFRWQGRASPPKAMDDAFSLCLGFPPILEKISDTENFSKCYFFSTSAKISDDLFLVIDHKFRISRLFSIFQYIFPLFRENFYFPLLLTISLGVLEKFTCFLHTVTSTAFPHVTLHSQPFPFTRLDAVLCATRVTYPA